MKLNEVTKRIPFWYQASVESGEPFCVYLKSSPGLGKTSVLVDAASQLSEKLNKNIGLVVINGPLLNPPDSIGYLMPREVNGYLESKFSDPFWFRTREGKRLEEYDGGIVVVDEADKMDTDVKKIIGEAALSGRLGPHQLPKGWVVWMAGNRSEDRSGSTKELDHLINRRLEIDISPDLDAWTEWACRNGVSPLGIAFANQHPEVVFESKVPDKQGPWCTPRSFVRTDKYLQVLGVQDLSDPSVHEEVQGMIGGPATAALASFMQLQLEMPPFEDIVRDPKGIPIPAKPDGQMLVTYNLAHRTTSENIAPVMEYMERMPKEFAVTFIKSLCARDYKLIFTPTLQKWAQKNSSLMVAVNLLK